MTTVLIVDDLNSIREFLKINLSSEPDIEVVGLADNGKKAIAQVEEYQPDIILMDINMPGSIDGIQATERIVRRFPYSKVLLLTSHDDRQQLDRALKAGSRGYILKNTSIKDIANIIRLAEKGFFQIGPILGNWDGSLHNTVQMSAGQLAYGRDAREVDAIIPHDGYSIQAGQSPEMSHTISNISSELFQLRETIQSQENTIVNLSNQYAQVKQEINNKTLNGRSPNKNSGFTVNGSRSMSSRAQKQQHLLFISSFLLGVVVMLVIVLLIAVLG
ncbi:MAG: response regulator transcription factor [Cyanobacteria bacterium P01_C01_bin.72]